MSLPLTTIKPASGVWLSIKPVLNGSLVCPAFALKCVHDIMSSTPATCAAEWYFRSSLDRYVWIHGMLFAYLHPRFEAALQRIDKCAVGARLFIRTAIIAGKSLTDVSLQVQSIDKLSSWLGNMPFAGAWSL